MTTPLEPFGFFRSTPFGWEDCSDKDEGAKALYEAAPAPDAEALQARIAELERMKREAIEREHVIRNLYKTQDALREQVDSISAQQAVLVDSLSGLIDFIEIDRLPIHPDALRIARAALAAVKPAGQEGGA